MAVIQPTPLPSGVQVSYWKIKLVQIVPEQHRATVYWAGYLNEAARASGKMAAHELSEDLPLSSEAMAALYSLVLPASRFQSGEAALVDEWKTPSVVEPVVEPEPVAVDPVPFPDPVPEPEPAPQGDPAP